ncbi:hypothetical protein HPB49_003313 [Dermacentor silvarum]|uniref:Uncharacterized protein n=1 Tax=Dermacentor silvarum TaxID=543639 RepID=A0ACB8DA45_DERSI|nr:hypothetical protein HPB49_003313 [Dermacentor silvarum]
MASQHRASVAAGDSNGASAQRKLPTEEDDMDFSKSLTSRKPTSPTLLPDAEDLRPTTREPDEEAWQTVLMLRQKRQQAKERLQPELVPEPFRGRLLSERFPSERSPVYTPEKAGILCPLCRVPEISRRARHAGSLRRARTCISLAFSRQFPAP